MVVAAGTTSVEEMLRTRAGQNAAAKWLMQQDILEQYKLTAEVESGE